MSCRTATDDGRSCCGRWSELKEVYDEGRHEEAVIEAVRAVREEASMAACKTGRKLRRTMTRNYHLNAAGDDFYRRGRW